MRRLLVLVILSLAIPLAASEFYVSDQGNDRNAGTSSRSTLRTVGAALKKAGQGDTVHLFRASVFREGALTVSSGVTLAGWGPQDRALPVIAGSIVLTGWTKDPDLPKVLRAVVPKDLTVHRLYVDGKPMTLARAPDVGWYRCVDGTTADLLRCPDLARMAGKDPWAGTTVRWRKWSWWFDVRPVIGTKGKDALELGGKSAIPNLTGIGSGFYVEGGPALLDAPGEWLHDPAAGILRLLPPSGVDPAKVTVEAAVLDKGIQLQGGNLREVELRHFDEVAVGVGKASTIEACTIGFCTSALTLSWNAAGTRISGNRIKDIWDNGIVINENPGGTAGTVVEHNHLEHIGTVAGQGGHGPWHQSGIIISNAKSVVVRQNRIDGTGYCGIILGADGQMVERNVFTGCMATLNDGAAIYTNCSFSIIRENVILGSVGDLTSSQPWTPLGQGIWLEFLEEFHNSKVIGNTVIGCGGNGIFLPNNYRCEIAENVLVGNRLAALRLTGAEKKEVPRKQEHVIRDNLLAVGGRPYAKPAGETLSDWSKWSDYERCLGYEKGFDYGTLTGTRFLIPEAKVPIVTDEKHAHLDLKAWQSAETWADQQPAGRVGYAMVLINDTDAEQHMKPPGGIWKTWEGQPATAGVTVPPWRSVVVIAPGRPGKDVPQYLLASVQR